LYRIARTARVELQSASIHVLSELYVLPVLSDTAHPFF